MFSKNVIISGIVSGIMLAATSFATPASAGQVKFNLEIGIESLLNELIAPEESAPKVHNIDYRGVPIRKIHRKMRRRGLYPVSEYRLRGDRVIIRAEDDYGSLFRVVADADYGNIIKIRRVREESRRRRAPVEQPSYYDDGYDNYRPGYDRPIRRNIPRNYNSRADRKAAKIAKARANAKRKAAKTTNARAINKRKRTKPAGLSPAQRKARKAARINSNKSKAARVRAAKSRRAAKVRADRNRRAARTAARPVKKRKLPYVGLTPEEYKIQQYGGGK